jgi:hypothetical protein
MINIIIRSRSTDALFNRFFQILFSSGGNAHLCCLKLTVLERLRQFGSSVASGDSRLWPSKTGVKARGYCHSCYRYSVEFSRNVALRSGLTPWTRTYVGKSLTCGPFGYGCFWRILGSLAYCRR